MSAVELIRVVVGTETDVGTALRIWSNHIPQTEPIAVETDEDGDTYAVGKLTSTWLELLREPKFITFSFTPNQKDRQFTPIEFFDDIDTTFSEVISLCASFIELVQFTSIQLEVNETTLCEDMASSMTRLREYLPTVTFPDQSTDGYYKVNVPSRDAYFEGRRLVAHAEWRNGIRVYTDTDDDGPRQRVDAAGVNLTLVIRKRADEELNRSALEAMQYIAGRSNIIRAGGLDAL